MVVNNTLFGMNPLRGHSVFNLIQWGEHLSVEHAEIDDQHKELFNLGSSVYKNWLNGGDLATLRPLVANFESLLKTHCSYEESLLAKIGYDDLDGHKAEHGSLLNDMATLVAECNRTDVNDKLVKGSLLSPGWPVTQLIIGFIIGHVSTSDMSYCSALKGSQS